MRKFFIALQFLTIFPLKIRDVEERELGQSLAYFPLVGAIIGLAGTLSLLIFSSVLPSPPTNILILIILMFITGAIHLDGFADTCDGFYAGKDKGDILQIMRDSHIGVMGVMGLMGILLLKFTLLENISSDILGKSLVVMCVLGRWAQVLACYVSNYAREAGKAKPFIEYAGRRELFISSLFSLSLSIFLMGFRAVILFIFLTPTLLYFIKYLKKRIGGMTGDTIGAVNEVTEIGILLFSSIFWAGVNI
ncbi:MAG: Adenosylcobinamide-GDP ribazoletransferase [Syntrophomonadaceae bacterium]|nr:Adenosylcobinamide-GDP ribazoletransferase [Bacillota bacterium]